MEDDYKEHTIKDSAWQVRDPLAHLFGSDSLGHSVQVKIPEVNALLRSLSDEALVEMFIKACVQIKQTDLNLPQELVIEGIVDGFARCNGCLRELKRREKLHLLDGIEDVSGRKE